MFYFPASKYSKLFNSFGLGGCLPFGPGRSGNKGSGGGRDWARGGQRVEREHRVRKEREAAAHAEAPVRGGKAGEVVWPHG